MFRSILVPLDGSTFAEHALPFAVSIARRAGARLELLHVHEPLTIPDLTLPSLEAEDREARRRACDYLDDVVKRLSPLTAGEVIRSLRLGTPSDQLCEFVAKERIDLVVMATHGRGPLIRFWMGSVATAMVRRLPVPVLLVRPREEKPDLATEPALRRILIPLDGSPFGEQILEPALALGGLVQAEYRLLRVVPSVPISGFESLEPRRTESGATIAELMEADARTYLKGVGERLRDKVSDLQTHVALAWPPAVAILDDAQTQNSDLIALATHGRGGLARLVLGSIADKVLRGASVPVLLQRPAPA